MPVVTATTKKNYATIRDVTNAPQDPEEENLRRGIECWREERLEEIEKKIEEPNCLFRRASFGLKCAHETPGVFDEKFIEELWDDLNSSATELRRLDEEHDRLSAMDLPDLVTAFSHDTAERHPAPAPAKPPAPEDPPNQVENICAAWRRILGIELDPGYVGRHLRSLTEWQETWRRIRRKEDGN